MSQTQHARLPAPYSIRFNQNIPYILSGTEERLAIKAAEVAYRVEGITFVNDLVLAAANKAKFMGQIYREAMEERKVKLLNARKAICDIWTAEKMHGHLYGVSRDMGSELIRNEYTMPVIRLLCYRLADDTRFISELGHDPRKGILLRGENGRGKSWPLECLKDNPRHPITNYSMLEIEKEVRNTGFFNISFNDYDLIHLDDVGTEEPVVHFYKNRINWFKTFIERYYMKHRGYYNRLIISTNESFDTWERLYGSRVRSRVAEMFNIIDVYGVDMRKLKSN